MAGKSKYIFKNESYFSIIDSERKAYFLGIFIIMLIYTLIENLPFLTNKIVASYSDIC